jgi:CBS domain containing-hemolysin-like protein
LRPVVFLLESLATGILRLTGVRHPGERRPLTEEQIEEAILTSSEQGQLPREQGHILRSVFDFSDTIAKEAMVPRTDVTFLHVDMTVGEVLRVVTEDVHSRFPVYRETPDRVIGLLHVKDLLPYVGTEQEARQLREVLAEQDLHPALFTPETTHLTDLLAQMQREHATLAVVVDEHGGVEGVVSIEDILEELVGDILDQEDEEEPELCPVESAEQTYLCHGRYSIDKLNRELGLELPTEGYDTVAGFVLAQLGEFPEAEGAEVVYGRLVLTVVAFDPEKRRINRVRIHVREPEPPEGEEDRSRDFEEED